MRVERAITTGIFSLDGEVHTGHGDSTTIGDERAIWAQSGAP